MWWSPWTARWRRELLRRSTRSSGRTSSGGDGIAGRDALGVPLSQRLSPTVTRRLRDASPSTTPSTLRQRRFGTAVSIIAFGSPVSGGRGLSGAEGNGGWRCGLRRMAKGSRRHKPQQKRRFPHAPQRCFASRGRWFLGVGAFTRPLMSEALQSSG